MSVAAALLFSALLAAPQTHVLESAEPMWDAAMEDFNGDGMADIAVLCAAERANPLRKSLNLYLAGEGASFGKEPAHVLELKPDDKTTKFYLARIESGDMRWPVAMDEK